jgi:hypothetical protein
MTGGARSARAARAAQLEAELSVLVFASLLAVPGDFVLEQRVSNSIGWSKAAIGSISIVPADHTSAQPMTVVRAILPVKNCFRDAWPFDVVRPVRVTRHYKAHTQKSVPKAPHFRYASHPSASPFRRLSRSLLFEAHSARTTVEYPSPGLSDDQHASSMPRSLQARSNKIR